MIDDGGAGVEAYGGGGSGGGSNNTVYATPANIHDVLRSRRGWWGDDDAGKPNCAIDLMILLDASGSVASDFPTLRSFDLRIGNGAEDAKVGLVVFNTRQATVFGLDTFDNNNDLDRALRNLGRDRAVDMSQAGNSYGFSIPSGGTKTRQGLQHLRDYLIPESKALAAASTNG
eukprot:gene29589-9299_t